MYDYIQCTCGRAICDYLPAYRAVRDEKYREYMEKTGIDIRNRREAQFLGDKNMSLADFFNHLHLALCCRNRLVVMCTFAEILANCEKESAPRT